MQFALVKMLNVVLQVQSQEQQRANSNSSKSLAAVVARLERNAVNSCTEGEELDRLTTEEEEEQDEAVVPRVLYEELVHSYRQQEEEMRRLQQELERTRRQLLQQAKKLKEYGSLLTEVKELRDFNRRLQDVLLMRLGSGESCMNHMYLHTWNTKGLFTQCGCNETVCKCKIFAPKSLNRSVKIRCRILEIHCFD